MLILLSFAIIALGLIRFNRNDIGISNFTIPNASYDRLKSNDAISYINMTNYYKGIEDPVNLIPPYTTRILVPFLASKLPFASDTSINIINLICMISSLFILYLILSFLILPDKYKIIGCLLYVFSFPIFYYGTVTYVDAVLIFIIFLGMYFILRNNFILLSILICIGTMVKESVIILIPVYFVYNMLDKKFIVIFGKTTLLLFIYLTTAYFLYITKPNHLSHIWLPSSDFFFNNISRPRTYLSFLLTFGIPGIICVVFSIYFYKNNKKLLKKNSIFIFGIILSIFLWLFSVLTAYSDGRFIWPSIVFSIPLSMVFLQDYFSQKKKLDNKIY